MLARLIVKWNAQRKMWEENLRISERLNRRKEEDGTTHVTGASYPEIAR